MKSISWAHVQEADQAWLRREKIWSVFALAFLVGFGWLFLNPHLIGQIFGQ